ncbi:MAG: hypothetical protein KDA93_15790 [Planctomycetaceae bacterium]|nr:hypothetical protein [Planctomycetaceae bacterium]
MTPSRLKHRLAAALLVGLFSGCAQLYDPIDEAKIHFRSCLQSQISWQKQRQQFQNVLYRHHFGRGYRAGYLSVCQGGNGCPPTLPPREYWTSHYQDAVGRAQSVEWFNGFAEGALAAQMDGRDRFSEIVTSHAATGRGCRPETVYHFDPDQSSPYPGDVQRPYDESFPHSQWGDESRTFGLPPAPESPPDSFPSPLNEHGTDERGGRPEELFNDEPLRPLDLPLPPIDKHDLPETGTEPPIPNIDFHVDTRPDGRPKELTPTGFLSPEQESGEQLGSRINALFRKFF